MTIASVICEYNPFHSGHKHQLDYIRQEIKADYIVCIMSGDFVQRGEPAIFSKELRTKWALENGADAVFLLPAYFSCAAADLFSFGAVNFLNKMGCIDYLCFGSESGDIERIKDCAEVLSKEGTIESPFIKESMKQGHSYPVARQILFPEYKDILAEPNNILALEYVMSLYQLKSHIKPVTLKRDGQGYNDSSSDVNARHMSATALRKRIMSGAKLFIDNSEYLPYDLKDAHKPLGIKDFSKELYYALLLNKENLEEYLDINEDLANRIRNLLSEFEDADSFALSLKTKNLTYARIMRALTHVLTDIKETPESLRKIADECEGLRLLGFRESARPLLGKISESSKFKIITKVPAEYSTLNAVTEQVLDKDLFVSSLYDKVAGINTPEYSKKIILV